MGFPTQKTCELGTSIGDRKNGTDDPTSSLVKSGIPYVLREVRVEGDGRRVKELGSTKKGVQE